MAERKPEPPVLRASIVDSGWEPEQPKERELPRYDEPSRELLVTRVDDQVQARAAAMNEEARASVDYTVPDGVAPPNLFAPSDERTVVDKAVPFTTSAPPAQLQELEDAPAPSLGRALGARVRVAGAEVPLIAMIVPLLALTALFSGLAGAMLGRTESIEPVAAAPVTSGAPPASAAASGTTSSAPAATPLTTPLTTPPAADPSDDAALAALEQKKPGELGTEEALALASGKAAKTVAEAKALADRLGADPALAKDQAVLTQLVRTAAAPETGRVALAAMARLPGPLSADLLYEVWTGTADKSDSTELARMLLLGPDVRPKASPALAVALDLRQAESCEDYQKLIPRATELGDKRSLAPLAKLLRRTGCGPAKRDDCFPCLRESDALKDAVIAVKKRREPELGRR